MALTLDDANDYIAANCIDIEDWTDADEAKKQRILNVASRTLTSKYPQYTIPDAAVYEFANELAIAFNDTNRLQIQGVASFGITGVANFTFKDWAKSGVEAWIPQSALDLIGAENGVSLSKRAMKWTVM
ncbi:hypothetical protein [uncultured Paenibacillus sp.]|uniref:hypothetical protein n=1 Tax=uncultured Paenibacillus sp. TaxID=227322 RepID=UPI0015AD7FD5|nr:hypothetical protein [uncultured Paenibacillus sp.]DAW22601.1 MAG TPA: hypothetical protein [Caudoviricetes sp.]